MTYSMYSVVPGAGAVNSRTALPRRWGEGRGGRKCAKEKGKRTKRPKE